MRSETSLVQTVGRAARNSEARVLMFADTITDSMQRAMDETNRRRKIQNDYNIEHNITPKTISKPIVNTLEITKKIKDTKIDAKNIPNQIEKLTALMNQCAKELDFERAILLREQIQELRELQRKGKDL